MDCKHSFLACQSDSHKEHPSACKVVSAASELQALFCLVSSSAYLLVIGLALEDFRSHVHEAAGLARQIKFHGF